jgi:hypothetical protein
MLQAAMTTLNDVMMPRQPYIPFNFPFYFYSRVPHCVWTAGRPRIGLMNGVFSFGEARNIYIG